MVVDLFGNDIFMKVIAVIPARANSKGLKNKKIYGACLDVFDFEKSSFEKIEKSETLEDLIKSDKVILSPHIAGWTFESYEKLSKILLSKILLNH